MSSVPYNQVRIAPGGAAIAWHRPEVEDDDAQPWLVVEEDPMLGVEHTWYPDEHVADWAILVPADLDAHDLTNRTDAASRDSEIRLAEANTRLAYAIAPADVIGEHSSANTPWRNALEIIAEQQKILDRAANALADQTQLKSLTVKDGAADLEMVPPREIVIAWVDAARKMLGDAPNYSETPIEFPSVSMEVSAAGEPERYIFTVQRAGKLTPHQARQKAEAECDQLHAQVAELQAKVAPSLDEAAELIDLYRENLDVHGHEPEQAKAEALLTYADAHACPIDLASPVEGPDGMR